jgi:nucleotide-binding universal stress UspA family protein
MRSQRIVVGVDGSPAARAALEWAVDECQLRGCTLLVVHALDRGDAPAGAAAPPVCAYDHFAEELLTGHAAVASGRRPGVAVTTMLSRALPADTLVELSTFAEIVVVGTRGNNVFTSTMLGSVSQRTAAHAHSPVAVVPQRSESSGNHDARPVVVGVAGGQAGLPALDFARREADLRGVTLQTLRADDDPAHALLDAAQHAQLLVVGARHSEGRWSTRLGAVPSSVLHRAACPVVVVGVGAEPSAASSADAALLAMGTVA